ncbi:putative threonylcarbamoyl-AMP synthase [Mobula birostris]|uniref:putative threonylcarbamoyl-AMP synthase n=1 Tax=Mobula birostris TaxID=1983395 RepID=UPI003B28CC2A
MRVETIRYNEDGPKYSLAWQVGVIWDPKPISKAEKNSIAIWIPDCAVTTHLIDQVGPIAVTSANPTGEADTTHHNQVYAKLGNKVDGVLCDGPSPENIASTVVDCTNVEKGTLGFFRIGIVPKSEILQLFEEVQTKHRKGHSNDGVTEDFSKLNAVQHPQDPNTSDNAAFTNEMEEAEEL